MQKPYTLTDHYNFLKYINALKKIDLYHDPDFATRGKIEAQIREIEREISDLIEVWKESQNANIMNMDDFKNHLVHSLENLQSLEKKAWYSAFQIHSIQWMQHVQQQIREQDNIICEFLVKLGKKNPQPHLPESSKFNRIMTSLSFWDKYFTEQKQDLEKEHEVYLHPKFHLNYLLDNLQSCSNGIESQWWAALYIENIHNLNSVKNSVDNHLLQVKHLEEDIKARLAKTSSNDDYDVYSKFPAHIQLQTNFL